MHSQIRQSDQTDDLSAYRAAQARAWMQRNAAQLRREFWDRKRADAEAGELWLAAHPE